MLLCPLCAQALKQQERAYVCPNGNSFDVARQGYVNLLPVQQKRSLQPGDTKEQVLSRRAFLDGGFYAPIRDALCDMAKSYGYKIVCACEKDSVCLYDAPLEKPVFLIVGGEKRGISKDILTEADLKVRIPYGRDFRASLTASAAAAVCAFEVQRKNR